MTDQMLADLLAYSAQLAAVAIVAGALARVVTIPPGARYAYWRGVLALCLLLPWVQSREIVGPPGPSSAITAALPGPATDVGAALVAAAVAAPLDVKWPALVGGVLIVGLMLRLMWIGISLRHLRRLRMVAADAPRCDEYDQLQRDLVARAEIRYVADLRQPVTFGVRRPLVLLPERLRDESEAIRLAVAAHELLHVRRRDWLWMLGEEAARAVLWFHPAVWWLISRVQLAREEAVDEEAIAATGRRKAYVEALMAFVDETPFVPVAAFARRRHLVRRISLISKEKVMSSRRVVISGAVLIIAVLTGSLYATSAFPLTASGEAVVPIDAAAGPSEQLANPVTPENPIPRRIVAAPLPYPQGLMGTPFPARLSFVITLDAVGGVAAVRSLAASRAAWGRRASDPSSSADLERIAESAMASIRQWQYEAPAKAPLAFRITLIFQPGDEATFLSQGAVVSFGLRGVPLPPPPPPPHLVSPQGTTSGFVMIAPLREPRPAAPVQIGGATQPTVVHRVAPIYPEAALKERVRGVVILTVQIDEDGHVTDVKVLRSIPLLDRAAIDAARQWSYRPAQTNGTAVPATVVVTMNFSLPD